MRKNFTHSDFDLRQFPGCPVKHCKTRLSSAPFRYGKKQYNLPYCETHGIRLHSFGQKNQTFVYHSDNDQGDARLRNICFEQDFVRKWILSNRHKAETHRLGYERSEDAVTWNVFVAILRAGLLAKVMCWLAGREIPGTPELYLWGCRIDLKQDLCEPYDLLQEARNEIEHGITRFLTEPDIMLVVPGKALMCIEAKFTSGNTLAVDNSIIKEGEKPKNKADILNRYLFQNHYWDDGRRYIDSKKIEGKFHSQLFRNIVFAAGMAEKFHGDWQVVNLVRTTNLSIKRTGIMDDFNDPSDSVRSYLTQDYRDRFTYRTWEGLSRHVVKGESSLKELDDYFQGKSAFFMRAFQL